MKWAHVLFDWDGCTAIVESKRLIGKEERKIGSTFKLSFDGRLHDVEILAFGFEEHHLHAKDNEWDRSVRAKAIAAVRDARELTRRGKFGGYLDVNESDQSDENNEEVATSPVTVFKKNTIKKRGRKARTPAVQQPAQERQERPQETQRKNIEGTNGRTVTILYEGSGDYEGHSSPKRNLCSFDGLTSDQVDIIMNQVESGRKNLISQMTNTEDIVIVQDENDIAALCKDCNHMHSNKTVHMELKEIKTTQKRLEKKMDNILDVLTAFIKKQESCITIDLNNSSFMIEPTATTTDTRMSTSGRCVTENQLSIEGSSSTLASKAQTSKSTPASEAKSTRSTTPASDAESTRSTNPASDAESSKSTTPASDAESSRSTTPASDAESSRSTTPANDTESSRSTTPASSALDMTHTPDDLLPPPVCETIAELVLGEENVTPLPESLEQRKQTRPLNRSKRFPSPCKANAVTTYISCSEDAVCGNYEFLVCPDILIELKDQSCSDGNFLLNTAGRIYKEEELEGRNYSGRKGRPGISPRRRHALQHAFAEHCSTNIEDFKRAVVALNSGIRGMSVK